MSQQAIRFKAASGLPKRGELLRWGGQYRGECKLREVRLVLQATGVSAAVATSGASPERECVWAGEGRAGLQSEPVRMKAFPIQVTGDGGACGAYP
ncbi:hypothetical protein BZZ01_04005 [Nostocales cyanobacterium HT-58-2]|nr:hypothetical protein BZZ01_04005 [Nostocales cyanobacterium HT-58-2]